MWLMMILSTSKAICSSHSLHGYWSFSNLQCLSQSTVLAGPIMSQLPSLHIILAYERSHHNLSSNVFNRRFSRQVRLMDLSCILRAMSAPLRAAAATLSSRNIIPLLCDSRKSYKDLEGVKDGRICTRNEEQKRCRICHVDSFEAQMLPEKPCSHQDHYQRIV
jgi:hypothetical protein